MSVPQDVNYAEISASPERILGNQMDGETTERMEQELTDAPQRLGGNITRVQEEITNHGVLETHTGHNKQHPIGTPDRNPMQDWLDSGGSQSEDVTAFATSVGQIQHDAISMVSSAPVPSSPSADVRADTDIRLQEGMSYLQDRV